MMEGFLVGLVVDIVGFGPWEFEQLFERVPAKGEIVELDGGVLPEFDGYVSGKSGRFEVEEVSWCPVLSVVPPCKVQRYRPVLSLREQD